MTRTSRTSRMGGLMTFTTRIKSCILDNPGVCGQTTSKTAERANCHNQYVRLLFSCRCILRATLLKEFCLILFLQTSLCIIRRSIKTVGKY